MLWLRLYRHPTIAGDEEFRDKHKAVFSFPSAVFGSPPEAFDKDALRDSYRDHLVQLGLVKPKLRVDPETGMPVFEHFTGEMEIESYEITRLGRLLLREIGLVED